jgi:hypothetical protein
MIGMQERTMHPLNHSSLKCTTQLGHPITLTGVVVDVGESAVAGILVGPVLEAGLDLIRQGLDVLDLPGVLPHVYHKHRGSHPGHYYFFLLV